MYYKTKTSYTENVVILQQFLYLNEYKYSTPLNNPRNK